MVRLLSLRWWLERNVVGGEMEREGEGGGEGGRPLGREIGG